MTKKKTTLNAALATLKTNLAAVKTTLSKVGITAALGESDDVESTDTIGVLLSLTEDRKKLQLLSANIYAERGSIASLQEFSGILPKLEVLGTSKKHKQAVLRLRESARTLVKDLSFEVFHSGKASVSTNQYRNKFGVALPRRTVFTATATKTVPDKLSTNVWVHTAKVTAKVPKSDIYFLVGYDEGHLFISCLPKAAKTVEEAHAVLLPKELKGRTGVLRQGEFFFAPCTEKEYKELSNDKANNHDQASNSCLYKPNQDGDMDESDHDAQVIVTVGRPVGTSDVDYVTGLITNERHKTLFLRSWYRVFRNNEVPNPGDTTTWD
jgi:hypothetical protein